MNHIRNFAIIAHINHGKSTLADRIIEICGAVPKDHREQLLDNLELEREYGVTIKLKAIRLNYLLEGQSNYYIINLIDTPGHTDFNYEVSRSLASVEGAVLLVDATQGVQAQTLANFNLALEANLEVIGVINKIDSRFARIEEVVSQLVDVGFREDELIKVSARTGENIDKLIKAIITKIPPPSFERGSFQALIFDSKLDPYKGVVATVRIFSGEVNIGDEVVFLETDSHAEVVQLGFLTPTPVFVDKLSAGEIGFIVTNLKDLSKVKVGDTITLAKQPAKQLLGYHEAKPVVFFSFYPLNQTDFPKLQASLEKFRLQDAALTISEEFSPTFGKGFRLGFLGVFHAQITRERLEREYGLGIIITSPSVNFEVDGRLINKPTDFNKQFKRVREPYALITIFTPVDYYGAVSNLIHQRRGKQISIDYFGRSQRIKAEIPLLELVSGFHNSLKSLTSGYASFDFEIIGYRDADLARVDVLINHNPVDALSLVLPRVRIVRIARQLVKKLKTIVPRHQFPVPIQAVVDGKVIARETIPAYRKNVTEKLYGGDVTRKIKLLEKQKRGKERLKKFSQVSIPEKAFLSVLEVGDDLSPLDIN